MSTCETYICTCESHKWLASFTCRLALQQNLAKKTTWNLLFHMRIWHSLLLEHIFDSVLYMQLCSMTLFLYKPLLFCVSLFLVFNCFLRLFGFFFHLEHHYLGHGCGYYIGGATSCCLLFGYFLVLSACIASGFRKYTMSLIALYFYNEKSLVQSVVYGLSYMTLLLFVWTLPDDAVRSRTLTVCRTFGFQLIKPQTVHCAN